MTAARDDPAASVALGSEVWVSPADNAWLCHALDSVPDAFDLLLQFEEKFIELFIRAQQKLPHAATGTFALPDDGFPPCSLKFQPRVTKLQDLNLLFKLLCVRRRGRNPNPSQFATRGDLAAAAPRRVRVPTLVA